jgi:hypothetical protein
MYIFISVFLMKFMDCALSTTKTVFLVKNQFFVSSILNSLSAALFIFVADAMANAPADQKLWIAVVVFLANLTGGYFPPKLIDRFEDDKLFVYIVTPDSFDSGKELADSLRAHNIPVSTNITYDTNLNKVLSVKAYAQSRQESKIISRHLDDSMKWHIVEAI